MHLHSLTHYAPTCRCLAEDHAPVPSVNQVCFLILVSLCIPTNVVDTMQIKFHIGMGADPEGLLSYCKSNGIVVEAYSPLGDNTTELITGALTTSIAHAHNKSSVQVLPVLRHTYLRLSFVGNGLCSELPRAIYKAVKARRLRRAPHSTHFASITHARTQPRACRAVLSQMRALMHAWAAAHDITVVSLLGVERGGSAGRAQVDLAARYPFDDQVQQLAAPCRRP